jgi:hypothetical protein
MLLTTILGKYVILKLKAWLVLDFMNWLSMGFSFIPLLWLIVSKKNHHQEDIFWVEPRQETH